MEHRGNRIAAKTLVTIIAIIALSVIALYGLDPEMQSTFTINPLAWSAASQAVIAVLTVLTSISAIATVAVVRSR